MNSYAWDTAILYIQKFSGDSDYSIQESLNTESDELAVKGTKQLAEGKQDKKCNIWDMASNCSEWTTETCNYEEYPCTIVGGSYFGGGYTSMRLNNSADAIYCNYISFRPILIL